MYVFFELTNGNIIEDLEKHKSCLPKMLMNKYDLLFYVFMTLNSAGQRNACLANWLSEWLLFNANSAIFLAISWQEQVYFQWDDDEVCFVLDQHTKLDFYSASSLKQQSSDRHVAPLGHIILIPSQPVFTLFP